MALQGKCRSCGKECESFFLHNGRTLCDSCFIVLANRRLRYRQKMRKVNAILAKLFYVALVIFAFICGLAVGQL